MRSRLFLASVAVLAILAGPAFARGTLDSILPEIRSAHPGRLSDAEPWTDSEGRTHYKIKWLTPEGRILFFNADADSGHYSNSGGEGDVGRGWRDDGGRRNRGDDDQAPPDDNGGGNRRTHWNGDGDAGGNAGGDGQGGGRGGGDWRDHRDGGGQGGGQDGGRGDWRGPRGGDQNYGNRGGGNGWRGGNGGGADNSGRHHHGDN